MDKVYSEELTDLLRNERLMGELSLSIIEIANNTAISRLKNDNIEEARIYASFEKSFPKIVNQIKINAEEER